MPSFFKLSLKGNTILSKAGETKSISNLNSSPVDEFINFPLSNRHPSSLSSEIAFESSFLINPDPSVFGISNSLRNSSLGSSFLY